LAEAIAAYLSEVRRFRSPKTIAACDPNKSIQAITREDLYSATCPSYKSVTSVNALYIITLPGEDPLLRANKITGLLALSDKPKYDEKAPSAYHADQLKAQFGAADSEDRLLFEFFLGPGFREQEVMHCTWRNVDFKAR
jgi:integrase